VNGAKTEINRQVTRLCDPNAAKHSSIRSFPDLMSKYFFASRVVANRRPDLMESTLIHGYEASFPFISEHLRHKIHDRQMWHHNKQQQEGQSFAKRLMTRSWVVNSVGLTMLLTTLLRELGTLPISIQKFTMQMTQPLLVGAFGFGFSYVQKRIGLAWAVLVITLIALIVAGLLAYAVYALFRTPGPDGSVVPVFADDAKLLAVSPAVIPMSPVPMHKPLRPSPNKYRTGGADNNNSSVSSSAANTGNARSHLNHAAGSDGQQFHAVAGSGSVSKGSSASRDVAMHLQTGNDSWSNRTGDSTDEDDIQLHGDDDSQADDVNSMGSWLEDSDHAWSDALEGEGDDGEIDWDNISDYNTNTRFTRVEASTATVRIAQVGTEASSQEEPDWPVPLIVSARKQSLPKPRALVQDIGVISDTEGENKEGKDFDDLDSIWFDGAADSDDDDDEGKNAIRKPQQTPEPKKLVKQASYRSQRD
jgi:hypothetical protein